MKHRPDHGTPSKLAATVGVSRQAVSFWFTKGSVPDSVSLIILEDLAGIPPRSFLEGDAGKRLDAYFNARLHAA